MILTVKKSIKSADGLDLYYEVRNEDGAAGPRPAVFFLHGVGGDVDAWGPINEAIVKVGYTGIAMDIRGHGYSSHPREAEAYHIGNLVEDVSAILEEEKIGNVFLVGHCYGAVIAMHFALRHPEKLRGLVVLSGTYDPPEYLASAWLRSLAEKAIGALSWISPPPIRPGHSYYPPGKVHKDYELYGLIRTIMRNSLRSYLLTSKELVTLDIGPQLSSISVPSLVAVGENDSIFPVRISEKIHREIGNSSFDVIPGGNHCIILNNAPHVIELLRSFLSAQT